MAEIDSKLEEWSAKGGLTIEDALIHWHGADVVRAHLDDTYREPRIKRAEGTWWRVEGEARLYGTAAKAREAHKQIWDDTHLTRCDELVAPLVQVWRAGRVIAKGYRAPANATTPLEIIEPPGSNWEMIHDQRGDVARSIIRDSPSTRFDRVRFFAVAVEAQEVSANMAGAGTIAAQANQGAAIAANMAGTVMLAATIEAPVPMDYGPVLKFVVEAIQGLPGGEAAQKGRTPAAVAKDIGHTWINTKRAMQARGLWIPKPHRK